MAGEKMLFALLSCLVLCGPCVAGPDIDLRPAEGVVQRLLPRQAGQFSLGALPRSGSADRFRISPVNGQIRIEGTTLSATLFGVNWYLKYVAHAQISPNGDQVPTGKLPLPTRVI